MPQETAVWARVLDSAGTVRMDLDVTVTGGGGYIQMPYHFTVAGGPIAFHFIHGDDAVTNGVLSPPAFNAVDFNQTGVTVTAPAWNEVDSGLIRQSFPGVF